VRVWRAPEAARRSTRTLERIQMDPALVAGLGMAGLYAAFLWLALRRHPRPAGERVVAGLYRDQWRRFRNLNRLAIGIFLLNPISWFLVDYEKLEKSTFEVLLFTWLASVAVMGIYAASFFRCPRCRHYFYGGFGLPRRYCINCGLERYEGA
jgi:hypothetical protein